MLGIVSPTGTGASDLLLAEVAERLTARGWPLAGAIQHNLEGRAGGKCHMDLEVLAAEQVIRISQDLGALSRGCRLDPAGLESAVGLAEAALETVPRPRLVIVNKYGKQELDGRGFRPLIGRALVLGIPVLTAVSPANRAGFDAFAEGMAEDVTPDLASVLQWVDRAVAAAEAA